MKRALSKIRAKGIAVAALGILFLVFIAGATAAQTDLRWEPGSSEIIVGRNVQIAVRLVDESGNSIPNFTLISTRLDMGPDGMEGMQAPLRPVPSPGPGIVAFETDPSMAGRWALTISAEVPGHPEPVTGIVVFTARVDQTEATPAAIAIVNVVTSDHPNVTAFVRLSHPSC